MNPIVLDNILPISFSSRIFNTLTDINFNWHYNNHISYPDKNITDNFLKNDSNIVETGAFVHRLYVDVNDEYIKSNYYEIIHPLFYFVEKETNLQIKKINRVRAVFAPKDFEFKNKYNVPHIDDVEPHITMIYYVNESNGATLLFEEKYSKDIDCSKKTPKHYIEAKKGRLLIFDGLTYHTGMIPTNNKLLINSNFSVF